MNTTQYQIDTKIEEIREATKYSNHFFKNREDLPVLEWMTRELKNSQFVYKIVAIPTMLFCVFLIIYTIGMGLEFFEARSIDPLNLSLILTGTLSLIWHSYQYQLKIDRLKSGLFLLALKEDLIKD